MYLRSPRKMILFIYFFIIYLVNVNCYGYSTDVILQPTNEFNGNLVRGSSVNVAVGPQTAAYCKLVSPRGTVFYNDFGSCRLSLDRVASEHDGYWQMHVGFPGQATFTLKNLRIHVIEPDPKTTVHTVVEESTDNIMTVTCSLPSGYHVRGCKFRGPHDMMLLASGTRESNDNIDKTGSRFETFLHESECGFRIGNQEVRDIGFWRCAMYTEQDAYYGFVTVPKSRFLNTAGTRLAVIKSIRNGPLLRVDNENIEVYKGEPVTVLCSINAPIKYCYFWSSDGTVINVSPGLKSSSVEYVGSGFDAGECGLKLHDLNYTNVKRRWSCNVGLATGNQHNRDFWVAINDRITVSQNDFGDTVYLSGRVVKELEYCRFVQDGGFGFSYNNTPSSRYRFVGSLSSGSCELQIQYPDIWVDYSPWTIVAKVKGEDEEISGRTRGLNSPVWYPTSYGPNGWKIFGWVLLSVVVAGILLGVSLGPQRNRRWVARRATSVRESFRRQQPPPYTPTS